MIEDRKRRQKQQQPQEDLEALRRAHAPAGFRELREPAPPHATDTSRWGVPGSDRIWVLSADQAFWWYEDERWWAYRPYHEPTLTPPAAAATAAAAAAAAPTVVYEIEAAAIQSNHLHLTAQTRRAEAAAARRETDIQSQAAVDASASAAQAANANAVTLRDALAQAERELPFRGPRNSRTAQRTTASCKRPPCCLPLWLSRTPPLPASSTARSLSPRTLRDYREASSPLQLRHRPRLRHHRRLPQLPLQRVPSAC